MFNLNELDVQSDSIFLKFKEGNTTIRIVSDFLPEKVKYQDGKETTKYNCWAIDRATNEVKCVSMSKSIVIQLKNLVTNPEYAFSGSFPYDVNISRKGTGLETVWNVIPARVNTSLTEEETKKVFDVGSLKEFMEKLRNKKAPVSANTPPQVTDADLDKIFG